MLDTTIVLNEIFVDLGSKSAKSNVGRWEIQIEEPKRDRFFSKFSLDIQKKVILYLDRLKAEDFKIDDKGRLLSISLKDEEWGYGEKKEVVLDSLHTFFHITVNPLAISDCLHKQSENNNVYPIFFSIVLEDCTKSEIDRIPVCFNVKLGKKTNKPSVTIELNPPEQVFNSDLKDEKIGYLPQMIDEEKLNLSISELLNKEIDYSLLDYKKYYLYIDMFHLDEDKLLSNEIKVKSLSGGERIKLFLLIELMKEPTTLLLDEPSNDLDLSSLNLLEELIKNIDMPVMFISHDESLLSKCANKIIHIESLKSKSEPRVTFKSLNYDDYFTSREDFLDKNIQEYKKDKENFEKKMDKFNKVYQSVNYALNTVSRSQPGVAKT